MAKQSIERRDVYAEITQSVLDALEAGTVPWHRPWVAGGIPQSMSTSKPYRGMNSFLLGMRGMSSPWWGTYRMISELGGQVRKGEKGTPVVFWKWLEKGAKDDETGETVVKRFPMLRVFTVFHASQADGLGAKFHETPEMPGGFDPIAECELVAKSYLASGPSLEEGGARACYSPTQDLVRMPERVAFSSAEGYYSTLWHELTHSTGHASRLARPELLSFHAFGDASYSREELVAEMGAAMLCGSVGIEQTTVPQSAAYIASWLKALRGDKRLVVTAAAQAQKAADLILGEVA